LRYVSLSRLTVLFESLRGSGNPRQPKADVRTDEDEAVNTDADRLSVDDFGRLLLRLTVGGLLLFHGVAKLINGVAGISGVLTDNGLPGYLAYAVYVGEVLAPILMIAGVWVRLAGVIVALNMATAILLAHRPDILRTEHGAWAIELPMLYLLGGLCVALLGPGRISLLRKASAGRRTKTETGDAD
jgi:putative oxidoreductase